MTCLLCQNWAATTPEQLTIRLRNMSRQPETKVHKCTACGGTDWATTSVFVVTAERKRHGRWDEFLQRWIKRPS